MADSPSPGRSEEMVSAPPLVHPDIEDVDNVEGDSGRSTHPSNKLPPVQSKVALARHTLGIIFLLVTVFLWTASNFLASDIFADDTYSKPFFVTYVNCSCFSILLLPLGARYLWHHIRNAGYVKRNIQERGKYILVSADASQADLTTINHTSAVDERGDSTNEFKNGLLTVKGPENDSSGPLTVKETIKLSLDFTLLWFLANYFVAASLSYTSVASSTILTSTSSIWTLIFGALVNVEKFTVQKLMGVLASIIGVVLTSSDDLLSNDKNRGLFPHKSHGQIAAGDLLALASAIMYGTYATYMKRKIEDESRISMRVFFGFVGIFSMTLLLPVFPVLHFAGIETFELPPSKRVLAIIFINSATSLVSDLCWAYAMLLTSPLVVTVGISLTIPVSLVGQMIINHQTSSLPYWIGAGIVLVSFIFINHQSQKEEISGHSGTMAAPPEVARRTHSTGCNNA